MMEEKQTVESMLFHYETTYRTDYRYGDIREYPKTVYKPRPTKYKREVPAYRNIHTLTEWKGDMPPFSLLHRPKDIVRENPNKVQQHFEKHSDVGREQAQKTRPRLVMTPAVSMDDIEDPRAREILCNDMYTSDMSRATREAVAAIPPYTNVKAPLPGPPAPSNPIALAKLQFPYVSPEWRMESITWDGKQLRGYCDPTKEFWLSRDPPKCRMCDESAIVEAHRKAQRNLKSSSP